MGADSGLEDKTTATDKLDTNASSDDEIISRDDVSAEDQVNGSSRVLLDNKGVLRVLSTVDSEPRLPDEEVWIVLSVDESPDDNPWKETTLSVVEAADDDSNELSDVNEGDISKLPLSDAEFKADNLVAGLCFTVSTS